MSKWHFRKDMLNHYINGVSSKTFKDAEDRLNYLEEKNTEHKIKEYVIELDNEIDRCILWVEEHMNRKACIVSKMEGRIQALTEVKNDLQSRLDELI